MAPSPVRTRSGGVRRSVELFRAFRVEQTDPDHFYRIQAADSVAQLRRYTSVDGKLVVDVGGGAGYFTEAFVAAGAHCILIEPEAGAPEDHEPGLSACDAGFAELNPTEAARRERHRRAVMPGRLASGRTIAGDGNRLPLGDGVADVVFSSNVLEHVPRPRRFLDEMVRVTRPDGTVYLSFTAWYSPWGGHETAPWHYLGGHRAARRYERRHGLGPATTSGRRSSHATWAPPCAWPGRIRASTWWTPCPGTTPTGCAGSWPSPWYAKWRRGTCFSCSAGAEPSRDAPP